MHVWSSTSLLKESNSNTVQIRKFQYYCSACRVSMITDQKPLVANLKKGKVTLWQRIWLYIHQYHIRILYKQGPQLFISNWLSRHDSDGGKDEEIPGMNLSINPIETFIDILEYMVAEEIRHATQEVTIELWPHWSFKDNIAVIEEFALEDWGILMLAPL